MLYKCASATAASFPAKCFNFFIIVSLILLDYNENDLLQEARCSLALAFILKKTLRIQQKRSKSVRALSRINPSTIHLHAMFHLFSSVEKLFKSITPISLLPAELK